MKMSGTCIVEKKDTFQFRYSAKQQEEIQRIRAKYIPRQEDKMEQLRRLDQSATRKGSIASLVIGVLGCLLLGVGMCCTMVWTQDWFIPGIVIGLLGILSVCLAYPLYIRITRKERQKLAPQILKLTEELSNRENQGG